MYANQLGIFKRIIWFSADPLHTLLSLLQPEEKKFFWPSVIFFCCKVCSTSVICSEPCSHRELLCGWPYIPRRITSQRRISPQGLIKLTNHYSSPWQMLLSDVPLMWKPASQLQCWAWLIWAQRGLRLNAGSFITLHSGGAASSRTRFKEH